MNPLITVTLVPASRSYRVVTDLDALEALLRRHAPEPTSRHAARQIAEALQRQVAAAPDEPSACARHVEHLTHVLATAVGEWLMARRESAAEHYVLQALRAQ